MSKIPVPASAWLTTTSVWDFTAALVPTCRETGRKAFSYMLTNPIRWRGLLCYNAGWGNSSLQKPPRTKLCSCLFCMLRIIWLNSSEFYIRQIGVEFVPIFTWANDNLFTATCSGNTYLIKKTPKHCVKKWCLGFWSELHGLFSSDAANDYSQELACQGMRKTKNKEGTCR